MKRFWLFLFSTFIAFGIAYYSKKSPHFYSYKKPSWKTFEKKSNKEIMGHQSTTVELESARIPKIKREIAQEKNQDDHSNYEVRKSLPKDHNYQLREERVLIGDMSKGNYQDEDIELEMVNRINPNWKEILGKDLLRFQNDDTKVMIKEEYPVIKIQNGKGQYLEQVIVTYVFKGGNHSSFHALIDSETGFVTETWDRTVNERLKAKRAGLSLPEYNNSGIIAR